MFDQITFDDLFKPMVEITKPIRILELFAGYGSQSMALRNIGAEFEHYRCVEFDEYAINSFNSIHGTDFKATDICTVHGKDLGIVERDKYTYLLTYSFPCTDISICGRQMGMSEGSGTKSALLWEVYRILNELKEESNLPDILLMENVTAIHSEDNKPNLDRWLSYLENLGYSTYISDLNASDYGVAQNRDRCFAVSILGNYNYKFPFPIGLNRCLEDYFEDLSEEDALRLIVKSEKAKNLLIELDKDGKLD